ncbi:OLC1v1016399C1 [Oldenlandia corymbosa var. corymbosa]|uniref:OLC1v1016399C1 n=1 Tax=Oldenlandia corymbosa var. corymbosa TaxID=529605 RepID=A0AAV1E5K7_OLDCO|nr:OLC1v1016399C1 [Oldenlandia corymbosa var. corymbosa]
MKINTVPFFWVLLIFLIPLLSGEVVSSQCLEDQKSLLLILKANLTNPSSDSSSSSSRLVNWDSSTDCCTWDGVKCDKSGHVMKLKLDDQTFSGRIDNSSVLFELQYLESLNLAYNNFYSIIPSGLYYKLRNLTYLNLSNAGFYGEISTDLGLMKRSNQHFPFTTQFIVSVQS